MLVRFLSPPEIPLTNVPPIGVFRHLSNCKSLIILSTNLSFYSLLPLILKLAAKSMHSFTVRVSSNLSSCMTYAPIIEKV